MELLDMQLGSVTQLTSSCLPADASFQLVGRDSSTEVLLATMEQTDTSSIYLACLATNRVHLLARLDCSRVLSASCSRDRTNLLASIQLLQPAAKANYAVVFIDCTSSSSRSSATGTLIVLAKHEHPVCCRLLRQSAINEPAVEYFLQIRCLGNGRGTVELKKFNTQLSSQHQLDESAGNTAMQQLHQVVKKHVICCQYCPVNRSLFLLHIDSFYGDVHQFTFTSLHCSANRLVYSIVCTFPIQLSIRAGHLGRHFSPTVPGATSQQVLAYSWQCTGLVAGCAMPTAGDHLVMLVDGCAGSGIDWLFKVFILPNRCVFSCFWPAKETPQTPLDSNLSDADNNRHSLRLRWLLSNGFVFVFIGNAAVCVVNANPGALPLPVTLRLDWPIFGPADLLLDSHCPDVVGGASGLQILSAGRGWRPPLLVGRFPISRRRLLAELARLNDGGGFAARLLHLLMSLRPASAVAGFSPTVSSALDSNQPAWLLLRTLLSNPDIRIGLALRQLLVSLVTRRLRQEFPQVQYRLCLGCYASELADPSRRGDRSGPVFIGPDLAVETSFGELFADISFVERPQSELKDSCWRRLLEGLSASRGGTGAGPLGRQVLLDALWRRGADDAGLLSPDDEDNDDCIDDGEALAGEASGFEVIEGPDEADDFGSSILTADPLAECADSRAFLSAALDESKLRLAPSFKYRLCRESLPLLQPHLPDQAELVTFQNALERTLTAEIGFLCRLSHWHARDPGESLACLQQLALCLSEFMPVPAGLQLALTCLSILARGPDQVLSRLHRCPGFYSSDWRVAAFALLHLPDDGPSQEAAAARRLKNHLLARLPKSLARRLMESAGAAPPQAPLSAASRTSSYRLTVPTAY
ncbi:hypothetical protein BOX15_Mlig002194g2 [Macrostomum lignano]|uniref:Uncharacterized protein n=1 Tax=Macrostomum lignano TaxID=282301 RepID=A0A267ETF4_9PLAT|nr:hypothetical protein BOX15_Mlig002194g2 [Macrostomum lignano]